VKVYAIDQSLAGFAHVILDNGKSIFSERIDTSNMRGWDRVEKIIQRVDGILNQHRFDVVVMENYAFSARTNNITKLAELGGCIKQAIFRHSYARGRDAILRGVPVFFTQTQSQMKKFCLGNGAIKKDSRYLLTVFEKTGQNFSNDDEADAYMHAYTAAMTVAVIRGTRPITDLTHYQREALLERGVKSQKGLSMTKALKLSDIEKRKIMMAIEVGE